MNTCSRCESVLESGARFCGCGRPTALASFEERNKYEAAQWRAYRARVDTN